MGLHQGAQGLLQRVQPYHSLAEGGVFELTQVAGEEASPWTETVDALTTAEHVRGLLCLVVCFLLQCALTRPFILRSMLCNTLTPFVYVGAD